MSKKLIAIADSHLGTAAGDVDGMLRFLSSLLPRDTILLFLGDLFHIWAGPRKFHSDTVRGLLSKFEQFRKDGGEIHLVAGNRDVLFPEISSNQEVGGLPFDTISGEFASLHLNSGKVAAFHGDTVNSKDRRYLRWRKTIRHPLFQNLFKLLPGSWAKKIMNNLEQQLRQTNLAFKKEFPADEWERFMMEVSQTIGPRLALVGHFHPDRLITCRIGETTGVVLPDWHQHQAYLEISEDLSFELKFFSGSKQSG